MMLVTTCPGCGTSFRISVGILEKAGGQTRCGSCASIFDANLALREIDESKAILHPESGLRFKVIAKDDVGAVTGRHEALRPVELSSESFTDTDTEMPSSSDEDERLAADSTGSATVGLVSGEPAPDKDEPEAVPDPLPVADKPAPSARARALPRGPDDTNWLPEITGARRPRTLLWSCVSAGLVLALAAQITHHYRGHLISLPAIGPLIGSAYAALGRDVTPAVDLGQYNLLDLTAATDSTDSDQDWLIIESRIHNAGPRAQPYPWVFVRLLDRWGDTIAGRYFSANEYSVSEDTDFTRMTAGSRIDAQFVILDPGPSATGFELELCTRIERGFLCESDIANN